MIAIVDYGMGNQRSVEKAFEFLGFEAKLTADLALLEDASHIVLPGVGAMADALEELRKDGLQESILRQIEKGKPFLGICLGMQMLFEKSYENGEHVCFGLLKGEVVPFVPDGVLKIPHMGWNSVRCANRGLFQHADGAYFYFVHGFHASGVDTETVTATCEYGTSFVCGVQKDNIYGVQFHPEKSGAVGLEMLKRFGGVR